MFFPQLCSRGFSLAGGFFHLPRHGFLQKKSGPKRGLWRGWRLGFNVQQVGDLVVDRFLSGEA